MGWASAGAIFDPVAQALVDLEATDEMKIRVLGDLIGALQDGDWDTEDESLHEFSDDPAIVQAFRQHGIFHAAGKTIIYRTSKARSHNRLRAFVDRWVMPESGGARADPLTGTAILVRAERILSVGSGIIPS